MSVVHIEKRQRWTGISNAVLEDKRLSFKARGLLAYLLSKPDDWEIHISALCHASETDGETAIRSALAELTRYGYASFTRPRQDGRFIPGGWMIRESPHVENRDVENPSVENSNALVITNLTKTEERVKTEKQKPPFVSIETSPPVKLKGVKRCPAEYAPSEGVRAWVASHYPTVNLADALEAMRDHEYARPRSDWDAALRTWIRNDVKWRSSTSVRRERSTLSNAELTQQLLQRQRQKG